MNGQSIYHSDEESSLEPWSLHHNLGPSFKLASIHRNHAMPSWNFIFESYNLSNISNPSSSDHIWKKTHTFWKHPTSLYSLLWQSPRGKRVVTHWASMQRWIWLISECYLMTRDSRKWTPMGGPFVRECRGSGLEKQQPKHNPCRPVGRNWNNACDWSKPWAREKSGTCLQCWQRSIWSVGIRKVSQHDPWKILGGIHNKNQVCLSIRPREW